MTNNINTTTLAQKLAFILIYYFNKEVAKSAPITQEIFIKAAWNNSFKIIDTAYQNFPDDYMPKYLFTDFQKQVKTKQEKIMVITNNF